MSYADAVADFINAMEMEGIRPREPVAQRLSSGELIRFRCEGDGNGRQNGWAILYLDEKPAGAFGNYRLGVSRKWQVAGGVQLSQEERRKLQVEWASAKQRREEERRRSEAEAARDAQELYQSARQATPDQAYVLAKGLDHRLFRQLGDKLLVPMFDGEGVIQNLQKIGPDGSKRFLRGGRTTGLFFVIGHFTRPGETACIGEGVATMHAVHRATGYPCIAAFSAKNILAVARLWWARRPDLDFIVCGDDDSGLDRNVGKDAAYAAASEIGARVALPLREAV